MKIPLEWLKELGVTWKSPEELATVLTQSGTEVIQIETTGCRVAGVVTAKILEKKPHPNADRLTLCSVDDGSGVRQVVCGAKNHQAGDLVPLAPVGTLFPDGMTIKKAQLRGETSEGMLCSAKELGLSADADGLLILPPTTKLGTSLQELYPGEVVFEVEITPNRPDLASAQGMARELRALAGVSSSTPQAATASFPGSLGWKVNVESHEDCPFYTLTEIVVKAGVETPDWMKRRLHACGLRSVSLVVDVTNYVLLEMGQPVHAFASERLAGKVITVRRAKVGEKLHGLDGGAHALEGEDLVVADEKGPVALAGIVGGKGSAVEKETSTLLLESARFHAGRLRKTARRLSLGTESSRRFARGGLDPALVLLARDRVIQLLEKCGALTRVVGTLSVGESPKAHSSLIPLRWERLRQIFGFAGSVEEGRATLKGLGFREQGDQWMAPAWRADVKEESDLMEELVRFSDLGKTHAVLDSLAEPISSEDRANAQRRAMRAFFVERGFWEILSGSLVRQEEAPMVRLSSPANPESAVLRGSLLPGLCAAAGKNLARGLPDLKLFEIGKVASPQGVQEFHLACFVSGRSSPVDWQGRDGLVDFHFLKGVLDELALRFAGLSLVGALRELSAAEKKRFGCKISAFVGEYRLGVAPTFRHGVYHEVSSFPAVQRDLALVLPDTVPFSEVEQTIRKEAPAEMEELLVFDRFRDSEGHKVARGFLSLGCRLQFRSSARTLTEQEVSSWEKKILEALSTRCQAKLRGVL